MKRLGWAWLAVIMACGPDIATWAVDTRIDVRVLSKGAKFIGTGVAGAEITIRDAETNELLARGKTVGDSGNGNTGVDRTTVVVAAAAATVDEE